MPTPCATWVAAGCSASAWRPPPSRHRRLVRRKRSATIAVPQTEPPRSHRPHSHHRLGQQDGGEEQQPPAGIPTHPRCRGKSQSWWRDRARRARPPTRARTHRAAGSRRRRRRRRRCHSRYRQRPPSAGPGLRRLGARFHQSSGTSTGVAIGAASLGRSGCRPLSRRPNHGVPIGAASLGRSGCRPLSRRPNHGVPIGAASQPRLTIKAARAPRVRREEVGASARRAAGTCPTAAARTHYWVAVGADP
jgi:hypothetical protein